MEKRKKEVADDKMGAKLKVESVQIKHTHINQIKITDEQLMAYNSHGLSPTEIARNCKLKGINNIVQRLESLGLEPNYKQGARFTVSDEVLREDHAKKLTNVEIGEKRGLSKGQVSKRLRRLGLKPYGIVHKFTDEEAIRVHKLIVSLDEGAKILGVSVNGLYRRWKKLGLECWYEPFGNATHKKKVSDDALIQDHKEGLDGVETARHHKLSPTTVYARWKKLGLKAPGKPKPRRVDKKTFIEVFRASGSEKEVKEALGMSRTLIAVRRDEFGLAKKPRKTKVGDDKLRELHARGLSASVAGIEVGLSKGVVWKRWKRLGLDTTHTD